MPPNTKTEITDQLHNLAQTKMNCPNCGSDIIGDGYTIVRHCENANLPSDREPDSPILLCDNDDENIRDNDGHDLLKNTNTHIDLNISSTPQKEAIPMDNHILEEVVRAYLEDTLGTEAVFKPLPCVICRKPKYLKELEVLTNKDTLLLVCRECMPDILESFSALRSTEYSKQQSVSSTAPDCVE